MLCVLGFHELANVIGLSHPGEKRRTNLQDRKYFQVSKAKGRASWWAEWQAKVLDCTNEFFYLSVAGAYSVH